MLPHSLSIRIKKLYHNNHKNNVLNMFQSMLCCNYLYTRHHKNTYSLPDTFRNKFPDKEKYMH